MIIRRTPINLAIRVTGTGTPLNGGIRGRGIGSGKRIAGNFQQKSTRTSFTGDERGKVQAPSTQRRQQQPLNEKLFHNLLQSPSIDFKSSMAHHLRTYSDASANDQISRLLPNRRVLEEPFELHNSNSSSPQEDAHQRRGIRYLLIHHYCNPATLLPSSSTLATRLLLYCSACTAVAQLGGGNLQQRWDRIKLRAEDAQVMLMDPSAEGTDTLLLLRWIADACGDGSLDNLHLEETRRFHIPALQLYRVLQLVVRSSEDGETTSTADITWLMDQAIAVRNVENLLPRQHPTSKRIDLVGGRVNWSSLMYNPNTRNIIENTTSTTQGDTNKSQKGEKGKESTNVSVALLLQRLSASFGKVSQDILQWHANGNIQKLEDFVQMICEVQFVVEERANIGGSTSNREESNGCISEAERQTLYLLGILGAIAVDGNLRPSSKKEELEATNQILGAFPSSLLQTKPLLYWVVLENIADNSKDNQLQSNLPKLSILLSKCFSNCRNVY